MGCFLACFGASKNKRRHELAPISSSAQAPKAGSSYKPVQQNLSPKQANLEESIIVVPPSSGKKEEHLRPGLPKKVTFDVPTYSPLSVDEAPENSSQMQESGEEKVVVNGDSMPDNINLLLAFESGGPNLSSLGSYPPTHRYHNCRDSDNEDEMENEEEIDVDDYDGNMDAGDEVDYEEYQMDEDSAYMSQEVTPGSVSSKESRTKSSTACLIMRNLDDMVDDATPMAEIKTQELNSNAQDRSGFAHSVLSPVENLTQWKAAKTKKENPTSHGERQKSPKSQLKQDEAKKEQQQAVDTSLSSWLVSFQKTPANKATSCGLEAILSETSASSHGSNSVGSHNDRPILGALTVEELKQISAASSLRRSPCQNAADKPIIGTVGSHWSEETPAIKYSTVSSFKGIPNTTSKYREDKRVNWRSTPFETRLEQALKKGASGASS